MSKLFGAILALGLAVNVLGQTEVLSNSSIVQMTEAGLSTEIIAAKIGSTQNRFDTSTQALIALKKAGVDDVIINLMMERAESQLPGCRRAIRTRLADETAAEEAQPGSSTAIYATPTDELETEPVIESKRLSNGRIQIRVKYERGGCFDLATALPRYSFLEIEGFDRDRRGPSPFTCSGRDFVGTFSPDEYARIPDGANIIKNVVIGDNVSKRVVGRLYKSPIE